MSRPDKYLPADVPTLMERIRRLENDLRELRTANASLWGQIQQLRARDMPTVYGDGVFTGGPSGLAAARAWLAERGKESDGDT